ncbi:hypothetical protein M747DRAFT_1622 [Aspergillus niger ATCC 13496]|uniref:Uncharacterized protein n=1 Tax=Aspergillus niger ATCC 13496 TaxID=1353008 RepID=A0A370CD16_ASPNG|nr:hypothetical protein M747DRAFT_1622 [Aspergillus niger ATCC 13496]
MSISAPAIIYLKEKAPSMGYYYWSIQSICHSQGGKQTRLYLPGVVKSIHPPIYYEDLPNVADDYLEGASFPHHKPSHVCPESFYNLFVQYKLDETGRKEGWRPMDRDKNQIRAVSS